MVKNKIQNGSLDTFVKMMPVVELLNYPENIRTAK